MPMYNAARIATIISGDLLQDNFSGQVEYLITDSRRVVFPAQAAFFALQGPARDGHNFIQELYQTGCRVFIVSTTIALDGLQEATVIKVPDTLRALQELAVYHRNTCSIPVIGITGSNGKTIVKEWLKQLLENQFAIVRSPKSYNSQIGVPLSVWQINKEHELGIFEAGISQKGEMEQLANIIQPQYGILTRMGEAHDEGFASQEEKLTEKLKLFKHATALIYHADAILVSTTIEKLRDKGQLPKQLYSWGKTANASLQIISIELEANKTSIRASWKGAEKQLLLPFTDTASFENAMYCWVMLLLLGIPDANIEKNMLHLSTVAMRLELKKGLGQSIIINDSYNADLSSLRMALEFLQQQHNPEQKTVILSDILQHGKQTEQLYQQVARELRAHGIREFIGIGPELTRHQELFLQIPRMASSFFPDTNTFLTHFHPDAFARQAVLLKGARRFGFEQISQLLEQKAHQTMWEINLSALSHNLAQYRKIIGPHTKLMAMVKAYSYGTGSVEIAARLQFNKVDYLTVAYVDEGVELRKGGIYLPIMVMNAEPATFDALLQYDLEPVVYSFDILQHLSAFMRQQGEIEYPIHLELETGMHRLGFLQEDVPLLLTRLEAMPEFKIKSVFSHLAASENPLQRTYTLQQFKCFKTAVELLASKLNYPFLRHISNTAGVEQYPELQLDMGRIGIGLYGVDPVPQGSMQLQPIGRLRTTIAQIKTLPAGATIGYNRVGVLTETRSIATVRIGYADGYPRKLGNGKGFMWVNGKLAPTIGAICMDMTMIDVTGIEHLETGTSVTVFGPELPVEKVASWAETIPYEIFTGISQRVKRVYYEE